jgi:hypothetical protein
VDAHGKLYFIDRWQQRIFGWAPQEGLTIERDNTLDGINLTLDKSGNIIVQSSAGPDGTVYAFKPGTSPDLITVLKPVGAMPAGASVAMPVNYWVNGEFRDQLDTSTYRFKTLAELFAEDVTRPKTQYYVSPDNSLVLPATRTWPQPANEIYPGSDFTGWRWSDNLTSAWGFQQAKAGGHVYVSNASEDVTYAATVNPDGSLGALRPFAMRGGESVTSDTRGNVYVANGQVFAYDASGKQIGRIDVPERPLQILFGGADRHTLFILTHHTLYAVKMQNPG